jgi:hypothetical protein
MIMPTISTRLPVSNMRLYSYCHSLPHVCADANISFTAVHYPPIPYHQSMHKQHAPSQTTVPLRGKGIAPHWTAETCETAYNECFTVSALGFLLSSVFLWQGIYGIHGKVSLYFRSVVADLKFNFCPIGMRGAVSC